MRFWHVGRTEKAGHVGRTEKVGTIPSGSVVRLPGRPHHGWVGGWRSWWGWTLLCRASGEALAVRTWRWFLSGLLAADWRAAFGMMLMSRSGFSRSPFRFQEWPSSSGGFCWWERWRAGWGKCCRSSFLSEFHEPEQSGTGLWGQRL